MELANTRDNPILMVPEMVLCGYGVMMRLAGLLIKQKSIEVTGYAMRWIGSKKQIPMVFWRCRVAEQKLQRWMEGVGIMQIIPVPLCLMVLVMKMLFVKYGKQIPSINNYNSFEKHHFKIPSDAEIFMFNAGGNFY